MGAVFAIRVHSRWRRRADVLLVFGTPAAGHRRGRLESRRGIRWRHRTFGARARHAQVHAAVWTESRVHGRMVAPAPPGVRARKRGAAATAVHRSGEHALREHVLCRMDGADVAVRFVCADIAVRRQAADAAALRAAGVREPRARHQQVTALDIASRCRRDCTAGRLAARASVALAGSRGHGRRHPGADDPGRATWPHGADHRQHEDCQRCRRGADGDPAGLPRSCPDRDETRARSKVSRPGSAGTRGNCRTTMPKRRVPASRISVAGGNCCCSWASL